MRFSFSAWVLLVGVGWMRGLPKLTDWCKTLNPRSPPLNMDASTKSHFCLKFPWYVHQKNIQKRYNSRWNCDDKKICGNLVKYVDPELRMCDDGDWWKIKSFHLLLPPYVSINSIAPWVPLCWGTLQHTLKQNKSGWNCKMYFSIKVDQTFTHFLLNLSSPSQQTPKRTPPWKNVILALISLLMSPNHL